ncbi:MAG TPA: glycosyltransferase [Acidimicrobiia bacterium]
MNHRIAYVTGRFPPMRTSGTYRVEAVMKYLPAYGFDPEVVTLPNEWMTFQARRDHDGDVVPAIQPEAKSDDLVRYLSTLRYVNWAQRELMVPDLLAFWARSAARVAADELPEVELVYGTAPPFGAMVASHGLARRLGVPLVQEIRDPPSFDRALRARSALFRKRMIGFERKYLTGADHVITVTPRTRLRLLDLHRDLDPARVHVVTNGYPDINVNLSLSDRDPGKFTIAYVGTFQGSVKARESSLFTPATLLPAISRLPEGKVEYRIVGRATTRQRNALHDLDKNDTLEFKGVVSRGQALAEIAAADIAVILADDDDWWIGRKAFEYLRYAHTILAIVPPGDTTDLLAAHSRVDQVSPSDLSQLPGILQSRFDQWASGDWHRGPIPEGIQTDETCVSGIARILEKALGLEQSESGSPANS